MASAPAPSFARAPAPRPLTNWNDLTGPIETAGRKTRRHAGQFLTAVSIPSGIFTHYVYTSLTAKPRTILIIFTASATFTLFSSVVGLALWFFNRREKDPNEMKMQRRIVSSGIENNPLVTLRNVYKDPLVFSDEEFNQWAAYLLDQHGYSQFLHRQTEGIFNAPLSRETLDALKASYIHYLEQPEFTLTALEGQRAFTRLLTTEEQNQYRRSVVFREARVDGQTYERFIERNGMNGLDHLDPDGLALLQPSFVAHVLSRGLGLVEIRSKYEKGMKAFNVQNTLEVALLTREFKNLPALTYTIFRFRNGIETIAANPAYVPLLKEQFLQLPTLDIVNPAFRKDRELLGITKNDVRETLLSRWGSPINLRNVLAFDRAGFLESLKVFFSPREWTQAALAETADLPLSKLFHEYLPLFESSVLLPEDGDLKARFAREVKRVTRWTEISQRYGSEFLQYNFIDPKQPEIRALVRGFFYEHADVLVSRTFQEPVTSELTSITHLDLIGAELRGAYTAAQKEYADEKNLHERTLGAIDTIYTTEKQRLKTAEESRVKTMETRLKEKEQVARNAELAYDNVQRQLRELQSRPSGISTANLLAIKGKQLEALQQSVQRLESEQISTRLQAMLVKYREAERALADAKSKLAPKVKELDQQIETEKKVLKALEAEISAILKLEREEKTLAGTVESLEFKAKKREFKQRVDHPDTPVTGVKAARQDPKKELEALEKQEQRLKEIRGELEKSRKGDLERRRLAMYQPLEEKEREKTHLEGSSVVQSKEIALKLLDTQYRELEKRKNRLVRESEEIGLLNREIESLRVQMAADTVGALQESFQLGRLDSQLTMFARAKQEAESALHTARLDTAAKSAEIREDSIRSLESEMQKKVEKQAAERTRHATKLQSIISSFRTRLEVT